MTAPERIWAMPARQLCWNDDNTNGIPVRGYYEYIRADLHDATKAQLAKAWETCFAATNRGMIAERKLAKAVEALRVVMDAAENRDTDACYETARAVLAEIEKGRV